MRFDVLGPLQAATLAGPVELPGGHAKALLAWLVLNANQPVRVEATVTVLWPATPPPSASAQVGVAARQLAVLLDGALTVDASLILRCPSDAVDAYRFEQSVRAAGRHLDQGQHGPARAELDRAIALWRGDPYPELDRAIDALAVIDGITERHLSAVEARYGLDLAGQVDYRLVAELRAATTLHPERARLWRQLALALYRTGRQVEALATLREAAGQRDASDAEADALQAAILRQDPALEVGEPTQQHSAVVRRLSKRV